MSTIRVICSVYWWIPVLLIIPCGIEIIRKKRGLPPAPPTYNYDNPPHQDNQTLSS